MKQTAFTPWVHLPARFGNFQAAVYRDTDGHEHLIVIHGKVKRGRNVLVRIHSECLTGNVFGSKRCDCEAQLQYALTKIHRQRAGVIIYLRQEGRGHGLFNKVRAYAFQDQGLDTFEADRKLGFKPEGRSYHVARDILKKIGVRSVRLLTNNPAKVNALTRYGINVQRVAMPWFVNKDNRAYLAAKKKKMGHLV